MFGLGKSVRIGVTAYGGSVPQPKDAAEEAATSIGQGEVLLSPLNMAMVAAAADTGTARAPRLVLSGPPAAPGAAGSSPGGGHRPARDDGQRGVRGHRGGEGPSLGYLRQDRDGGDGTKKPLKLDAC